MKNTFEVEAVMQLDKGGIKREKYLISTIDDIHAIEIAKSMLWKSLGCPDGLLYIMYCREQRG